MLPRLLVARQLLEYNAAMCRPNAGLVSAGEL
jgi:hypothetical protein